MEHGEWRMENGEVESGEVESGEVESGEVTTTTGGVRVILREGVEMKMII